MKVPHILIVDDDPDILRVLEVLFATEGYEVTTCTDGSQAIAAFHKEEIDVIVTDFMMPKIHGLDLLAAVKKGSRAVPVILITGHGSVERAVEAMKSGAYDFFTKPLNNKVLQATVAKALETLHLVIENQRLKNELSSQFGFENIITNHPDMLKIFQTLRSVGDTDVTILISGESGTGKELIARSVHYQSRRRNHPFCAVNCAAIPGSLLESEFFGHEKGAFTGAISRREGKFEAANGGSLFLDEIGDMSLDLQAKLLRVLEGHEYQRVGGNTNILSDIRLIAASNNLAEAVTEKKFREDLYYRLNVVTIHLPPLRERKSDILLLAESFITKFAEKYGRPPFKLNQDAVRMMENYRWPGNIRELENYIERLVVTAHTDILKPEHLPVEIQIFNRQLESQEIWKSSGSMPGSLPTKVADLEVNLIRKALEECDGNQSKAAKLLGVTQRIINYKIQQYGINILDFRKDDLPEEMSPNT